MLKRTLPLLVLLGGAALAQGTAPTLNAGDTAWMLVSSTLR